MSYDHHSGHEHDLAVRIGTGTLGSVPVARAPPSMEGYTIPLPSATM